MARKPAPRRSLPVPRHDGWENAVTGLGGMRDKRGYSRHVASSVLDQETLQGMYDNDDLAATICNIVPEQALRQGFDLTIEDDTDLKTDVLMRADELGLTAKILEAAIWGNVYGAGAVLMGVDDGLAMDKPLRPELKGVRKLAYLNVLERRDLIIHRRYDNPLSPNYGEPSHYRIVSLYGGTKALGSIVHESRMLMFWGARTGRRSRLANAEWPLSRLQRVYEVLRDFGVGWGGASLLLQEASQAVYGIKDLADLLLAPDGEERMQRRMRMIDASRSIAKAVIIDAESESFERKATSFAGVPDMLDRFAVRLAAAARVPVTVLMGQSPAGLNATGASDVRGFYDDIAKDQRDKFLPAIERAVRILLVEGGRPEPESWRVSFPSLYQQTEAEKAKVRLDVASTDKIYFDMGAVTPEEIGMSRFGAEGYSMETTIDLDLRKEIDKLNEEKLLKEAEGATERAGQPPPVPPLPGAEPAVDAEGKPVAAPPGAPAPGKRPAARAGAFGKPPADKPED